MNLPIRHSLRRLAVFAAALVAFALVGAFGVARASVPTLMNYQGYLADNAGNPANGSYTIQFTLYSDSLTGGALWSETYSGVQVSAGVFNVLLGSVSPLTHVQLDGHKLWLLTTVNGTDVLPRRPIVSVAYAFRSMVADSATRAGAVGSDIVGQVQISCGSGPALVYIPGRSFVAYTASDGTFDLSGVPAGTYTLHIEAPGSGSTNLTNVVVTVPGVTNVGVVALGANLQGDPNNCGSCGHVCSSVNATASCVAGNCQLTCNPGYFDCDGMPSTGCEVAVNGDPNNCGYCGNVCASGPNASGSCVNGSCQFSCNAGYMDCDNQPANGCEIAVISDPNNCGGCGHVCAPRPNSMSSCSGGTCNYTCSSGYSDCNGITADGCEINVLTDANNCGGCGNVCGGLHVCVNGACQ